MDLSSLDTKAASDQGSVMQLRHPKTDELLFDEATGEPVSITVLGQDSAEFRRISRSQQNRRIEKASRTGGSITSADELEANALEILVGCTKGWQHIVVGEKLDFSPANAKRLYSTQGLSWIREQVDAYIGKRANFLGNLPTT